MGRQAALSSREGTPQDTFDGTASVSKQLRQHGKFLKKSRNALSKWSTQGDVYNLHIPWRGADASSDESSAEDGAGANEAAVDEEEAMEAALSRVSAKKRASSQMAPTPSVKSASLAADFMKEICHWSGNEYIDDTPEIRGIDPAEQRQRRRRRTKTPAEDRGLDSPQATQAKHRVLLRSGTIASSFFKDIGDESDEDLGEEGAAQAIEHITTLYLDYGGGLGAGKLAKKVQALARGELSEDFIDEAKKHKELRDKVKAVEEQVQMLEDLARRNEEGTGKVTLLDGLLGQGDGAPALSRNAETAQRMRLIRKTLQSLNWPNLHLDFRKWVKRSDETEIGVREFLKGLKTNEESFVQFMDTVLETGVGDVAKDILAERGITILSELERFHKYMTEKRTELKQIGTAKKAREDAEKKAANSTVEEAADEDAGEGAPIVSPVPGSPRDVDPGRNKTNRLLQQALMKHRVVKRLDHSRFRSSSSRGSVEEGAAEQVAAAIEASQPREEEERPFDIDDFDDQRFGHLKKIFLKHRDKILESRSTIDKATEQVKVVQDELMRSLREDEEDAQAPAVGRPTLNKGASMKVQHRLSSVVASMGPEAMKKYSLQRERDAMIQFLNAATSPDIDEDPDDRAMRRSAVEVQAPGRLHESPIEEHSYSKSSEADARDDRVSQDAKPLAPPPRSESESLPSRVQSDARSGDTRSGDARSGDSSAEATGQTVRTTASAFQSQVGGATVELAQEQLSAMEEEMQKLKSQAAQHARQVNQKASEYGVKKAWAFEMAPTFQAWFLVSPKKPLLDLFEGRASDVLQLAEDRPEVAAAAGEEFRSAVLSAKGIFEAEAEARRLWYEGREEFDVKAWREKTEEGIASLKSHLEEAEKNAASALAIAAAQATAAAAAGAKAESNASVAKARESKALAEQASEAAAAAALAASVLGGAALESVAEDTADATPMQEVPSPTVVVADAAGQSADDAPTSPAKKSGKTGKKKRLVDEPQQVAPAGAQPSPSPQGVAATGAPGEDRRQRTVAAPDPKVQKEALEKRCNQGEELLKVTRLVRELNDEAERLKGELRRHRGGGGVAAPVEKRSGAAAKGQLPSRSGVDDAASRSSRSGAAPKGRASQSAASQGAVPGTGGRRGGRAAVDVDGGRGKAGAQNAPLHDDAEVHDVGEDAGEGQGASRAMARTASGKRRASEADRHSSDSRAGRQDGAQAVEVAPKVQEMQLGMAASESQKGLRGRAMSAASVSRPKRKSDDDSGFRVTNGEQVKNSTSSPTESDGEAWQAAPIDPADAQRAAILALKQKMSSQQQGGRRRGGKSKKDSSSDVVGMIREAERAHAALQQRRDMKYQAVQRLLDRRFLRASTTKPTKRPELANERTDRLRKALAEANETVKSLTRMLEFWSSRIRQRQSKVAEEQENAGADERDGFSDWDQVLNATRRSTFHRAVSEQDHMKRDGSVHSGSMDNMRQVAFDVPMPEGHPYRPGEGLFRQQADQQLHLDDQEQERRHRTKVWFDSPATVWIGQEADMSATPAPPESGARMSNIVMIGSGSVQLPTLAQAKQSAAHVPKSVVEGGGFDTEAYRRMMAAAREAKAKHTGQPGLCSRQILFQGTRAVEDDDDCELGFGSGAFRAKFAAWRMLQNLAKGETSGKATEIAPHIRSQARAVVESYQQRASVFQVRGGAGNASKFDRCVRDLAFLGKSLGITGGRKKAQVLHNQQEAVRQISIAIQNMTAQEQATTAAMRNLRASSKSLDVGLGSRSHTPQAWDLSVVADSCGLCRPSQLGLRSRSNSPLPPPPPAAVAKSAPAASTSVALALKASLAEAPRRKKLYVRQFDMSGLHGESSPSASPSPSPRTMKVRQRKALRKRHLTALNADPAHAAEGSESSLRLGILGRDIVGHRPACKSRGDGRSEGGRSEGWRSEARSDRRSEGGRSDGARSSVSVWSSASRRAPAERRRQERLRDAERLRRIASHLRAKRRAAQGAQRADNTQSFTNVRQFMHEMSQHDVVQSSPKKRELPMRSPSPREMNLLGESSVAPESAAAAPSDDVWRGAEDEVREPARQTCAALQASFGGPQGAYKALCRRSGGVVVSRGALSAAALAGEVGDVDPSRLDEVFSLFASAAGLPPGVTRELNRQEFVAAMRFFAPIRCMAEFRARLLQRHGSLQAAFAACRHDGLQLSASGFAALGRSVGIDPSAARILFQQMMDHSADDQLLDAAAFFRCMRHAEGLDALASLRAHASQGWKSISDIFPQLDASVYGQPLGLPQFSSVLLPMGVTKAEARSLMRLLVEHQGGAAPAGAVEGGPPPEGVSGEVFLDEVALRAVAGFGPAYQRLLKENSVPEAMQRPVASRRRKRRLLGATSPESPRAETAAARTRLMGRLASSSASSAVDDEPIGPLPQTSPGPRSPAVARQPRGRSRSPGATSPAPRSRSSKRPSSKKSARASTAGTAGAESDISVASSDGTGLGPDRATRRRVRARLRGLGGTARFRTFQGALARLTEASGEEEPHKGLTRRDFIDAMREGLSMGGHDAGEVFDVLNACLGRPGRVSLAQLVRAARRARPVTSIPQLRNIIERKSAARDATGALAALDPHNTGSANAVAFERWLVDLGVVAADARHLFGLLDADGDGLVTHRELRSVWDRLRDEETGSLKSESMAKLRRNLSRCRTALRDRIDERSGQPLSKDFSAGELLRVLTEVGVPAQSAWDLFTLVAAQESTSQSTAGGTTATVSMEALRAVVRQMTSDLPDLRVVPAAREASPSSSRQTGGGQGTARDASPGSLLDRALDSAQPSPVQDAEPPSMAPPRKAPPPSAQRGLSALPSGWQPVAPGRTSPAPQSARGEARLPPLGIFAARPRSSDRPPRSASQGEAGSEAERARRAREWRAVVGAASARGVLQLPAGQRLPLGLQPEGLAAESPAKGGAYKERCTPKLPPLPSAAGGREGSKEARLLI